MTYLKSAGVLLALIGCFTLGWGQSRAVRGGEGHFEMGPSFLDLGPLNRYFEQQQLNTLSHTFFALGMGYNTWKGNWVYGGDLYGYMLQQDPYNGQLSGLIYSYLLARGGYRLTPRTASYELLPTVGFGGGMGLLKLRAIDDLETRRYYAWGTLIDAGITFTQNKPFGDESGYGFTYGLKAGYLFSPFKDWQIRDISEDQLTVAPQGPYVRLILGIGR